MPESSYRERVLDLAIEQLPDLRDATLVQERVCFYDYSPEGDFILDQWDENDRLIVACGFQRPRLQVWTARWSAPGAIRADRTLPSGPGAFRTGAPPRRD